MSSRLSAIIFIVLCLGIGIVLTILPWVPQGWWGLSDWGNNYFLYLASRKDGSGVVHALISSGWVRGAVSGIGILNLGMAIWETINFGQTLGAPDEPLAIKAPRKDPVVDATRSEKADPLSDYRRQDD